MTPPRREPLPSSGRAPGARRPAMIDPAGLTHRSPKPGLRYPARPARRTGLSVLITGLAATALALTGCTSVPDAVDDLARNFGVEINPDRTDLTSLTVGDCFNGFEDEGRAVATVDCAEEHDSELIHVLTVPASVEEFPGDPEEAYLWREHEEPCYGKVFEDYVGEPYDTSSWDVATYIPTEWAWAEGDRTIQCVVYSLEGQYWTGSPSTGDAVVTPLVGPDGEPLEVPGNESGNEDGAESGPIES